MELALANMAESEERERERVLVSTSTAPLFKQSRWWMLQYTPLITILNKLQSVVQRDLNLLKLIHVKI